MARSIVFALLALALVACGPAVSGSGPDVPQRADVTGPADTRPTPDTGPDARPLPDIPGRPDVPPDPPADATADVPPDPPADATADVPPDASADALPVEDASSADAADAGTPDAASCIEGAPCDDGDQCTAGDRCRAGRCEGAPRARESRTCDGADEDCDGVTDEDCGYRLTGGVVGGGAAHHRTARGWLRSGAAALVLRVASRNARYVLESGQEGGSR